MAKILYAGWETVDHVDLIEIIWYIYDMYIHVRAYVFWILVFIEYVCVNIIYIYILYYHYTYYIYIYIFFIIYISLGIQSPSENGNGT